jgi:hypothetical protein
MRRTPSVAADMMFIQGVPGLGRAEWQQVRMKRPQDHSGYPSSAFRGMQLKLSLLVLRGKGG